MRGPSSGVREARRRTRISLQETFDSFARMLDLSWEAVAPMSASDWARQRGAIRARGVMTNGTR